MQPLSMSRWKMPVTFRPEYKCRASDMGIGFRQLLQSALVSGAHACYKRSDLWPLEARPEVAPQLTWQPRSLRQERCERSLKYQPWQPADEETVSAIAA